MRTRPPLSIVLFLFLCIAIISCSGRARPLAPIPSAAEQRNMDEANTEAAQMIVFKKSNGKLSKDTLQIAPEDSIDIRIKDQPELSGTFKVDPWGYIKTPYIDEIQVSGLNTQQLAVVLRERYSDFFKSPPVVDVAMVEYNSQVIYVLGAVTEPGRYPLIQGKPSTIRDAIVAAKLPTVQAALWRAWVIRQSDQGPLYRHVNLYKILYRGRLEENIELRSGDIVYLPMGIIDGIVNYIGRILSPITGVGRTAAVSTVR